MSSWGAFFGPSSRLLHRSDHAAGPGTPHLHDTTARRNNDIQDAREGHHILDNAPHGRSDGPGALDGAEELRGGAEVEAARVAGGAEGSERGAALDDSSLEVSEAVRVEGAAHIG